MKTKGDDNVSIRPNLPDGTELLRRIEAGEYSAEEVVRECLDQLDRNHDRLNGAVKIYREQALEQGKSPRPGPLSGLPVSIKETFGIKGEFITACSRRMPPAFQKDDSEIVRRIREAGAIIIARSNVPEFAMSHETDNLIYGRTNSPLDETRTSGGSSGGEGALVGSGSSVFGLGSDLGGSIRYPAQCCGIVGFKPYAEAVDTRGTFPVVKGYTKSMLALGPLTRSIRDTRMVYNVIAKEPVPPAGSPGGLRLIIPDRFRMTIRDTCIGEALRESQRALEAAGMVSEHVPVPEVPALYYSYIGLITKNFEKPILSLLTTSDGRRLSKPVELLRHLTGRPTVWKGLFLPLLGMPLARRTERKVERYIETVENARRKYHTLLGRDGIMLLPTSGALAAEHGQALRMDLRPGVPGIFTPTYFCNLVNLSAISLPAWSCSDKKSGLPPSIMLASAPGAEAILLDAAASLEKSVSMTENCPEIKEM